MLEAGAQNAEALVGPLVEAVLMEAGQRGEGACSQLRALGLPLPPLNAKACIEIMTKHPAFSPRLPVTIHKRLATAATCLAALDTDQLGPEQAVAGQTALRGVLQDCLKAMKLPSLMAAGSTQFQAFLHSLQPHLESGVQFADMLVLDASEAAAEHKQRSAQRQLD
ncbi:uncharacterized protein HaLaN_10458 [Haematococcus lacustris]|uniref:Uncharacterized protein n=1 Tax=Haematococcus lacustris TaxID=44745 RepID=A0A699Z5P5_HAELA|nr:uncharacterized protein HaLaN_10458 [Haematococcus lacustris]